MGNEGLVKGVAAWKCLTTPGLNRTDPVLMSIVTGIIYLIVKFFVGNSIL
jgi:hypothetical protein